MRINNLPTFQKGAEKERGSASEREGKREVAATLRQITKRGRARRLRHAHCKEEQGCLGRNMGRQDNPTHELAKLAC